MLPWDESAWWKAWEKIVPVTIFGKDNDMCNLSPCNPTTGTIKRVHDAVSREARARHRGNDEAPGDLNVDLLYLSCS